jgi:hypothetical protein
MRPDFPLKSGATRLFRGNQVRFGSPPVTCAPSVGDFVKGIREIADVHTTGPLVLRYKDDSSLLNVI